jgi:hypothetical protein
MKSAQERAEKAAAAIGAEALFRNEDGGVYHGAAAKNVILRETNLPALVKCAEACKLAAEISSIHDGQVCCDDNDKCSDCRAIDAAKEAIKELNQNDK